MTELERLANKIMKECEKDGEPVTLEEATEMAQMELKDKSHRRYEQSAKPRKKAVKTRKIDETKKHLLACCKTLLEGMGAEVTEVKTETVVSFLYNNEAFSFKLTRHRPKD